MLFRVRLSCLVLLMTLLAPMAAVRAAPPTPDEVANAFTDEEIIEGFMGTVFGAEAQQATDADIVRKFVRPIGVLIVNRAAVDRTPQVAKFIATLNKVVDNLRIRVVKREEDASLIVYLLERSAYSSTIRETLPAGFDTTFMVTNHCSGVASGTSDGILKSATVFIPTTEGWRHVRHCMVEEITQVLGPVNDDEALPNSIFNDYSDVPGFGIFDWFILNTLYDRRIKPGMSPDEARKLLPAVIADARKRLKRLVATKVIDPGRKPGE